MTPKHWKLPAVVNWVGLPRPHRMNAEIGMYAVLCYKMQADVQVQLNSSSMGCFQSTSRGDIDVCSCLTLWNVTEQSLSHTHQVADIPKRDLWHGPRCVGTCLTFREFIHPSNEIEYPTQKQHSAVQQSLYLFPQSYFFFLTVNVPFTGQNSICSFYKSS